MNDCNIRAMLACVEEIDPSFKITESHIRKLKRKFGSNPQFKTWQKETYPSVIFDKESSYTKFVSAVYGMSLFMPKYSFKIQHSVDIKKLPLPCVVVIRRNNRTHSICLTEEDDVYFKVKDSEFPGCSLLMSKDYALTILDEPGNVLKFVVTVELSLDNKKEKEQKLLTECNDLLEEIGDVCKFNNNVCLKKGGCCGPDKIDRAPCKYLINGKCSNDNIFCKLFFCDKIKLPISIQNKITQIKAEARKYGVYLHRESIKNLTK